MRKIIILLLFIIVLIPVKAQEMLGIVNSNYAGSVGSIINPSSIVNSKLYMDINLVTADIFAQNNYLYIHGEDYKLFQFLKRDPEFPMYGENNQAFDHYLNEKLKYGFSNVRIIGPSAMVVKGNHAFALTTGVRTMVSLNRIPYEIANFAYEGLYYPSQFNINYNDHDFDMTAMAWGEIGLTYAYIFKKIYNNQFSAGITLKRLFGYSGGYMRVNNIDYVVPNDSTADIRNLDAEVGYSLPLNYYNNDFPDDGKFFKGGGFGLDIGITYQKKARGYSNRKYNKLCQQPYEDYVYRIGISIIDIGSIKFKENAQKHVYDNVSTYWEEIDTLKYHNIHELSQTISNQFYGDPDESLKSNKISISLPAAFSFQVDYHYNKNWYINSTFIYPVKLGKISLRRPSQISITPRYEKMHYEFAVPISLYDFKQPRIGLSVRLYFLTIGTDKLGGFFGFNDFTGMDIYFSVKINFQKGFCFGGKRFMPCQNNEFR